MVLRAFALLLVTLLQSSWAVSGAFHVCGDQVRTSKSCCCNHEKHDGTPALQSPRAACCESASLEAPELLARSAADEDGARVDAQCSARSMHLDLRHGSSQARVPEREAVPPPRETASWRATAPPLFLRNCSLLL